MFEYLIPCISETQVKNHTKHVGVAFTAIVTRNEVKAGLYGRGLGFHFSQLFRVSEMRGCLLLFFLLLLLLKHNK